MPDVHVVPAGDQWVCGNARSTHDTQDEAI